MSATGDHADCDHGGTFADYRDCLAARAAAIGPAGIAQVDQFDAWYRNVQDWHLWGHPHYEVYFGEAR